ncbi:MAG: dUTP diphosphatase [candidate division WOR-3 bacterium]
MEVSIPLVRIRRLTKVPLPYRATPDSAGFDVHAAEEKVVRARSWAIVRTGIVLELPKGTEAQLRPRSGLASRYGIGLLNSPGTIDADYRGEIKIILFNLSNRDFVVQPHDRIAQLVFCRPLNVDFVTSNRLSRTARGKRGLGHTGTAGRRRS